MTAPADTEISPYLQSRLDVLGQLALRWDADGVVELFAAMEADGHAEEADRLRTIVVLTGLRTLTAEARAKR